MFRHHFTSTRLALLALPLTACTALTNFGAFHAGGDEDAGLDARVSSSEDVGTVDAFSRDDAARGDTGATGDAGADECEGACRSGTTCCDGECEDLSADPVHCGECGNVCADGDNATPSCVDSRCALDCEDGFEDCDGDISTGCEADLGAPETCGSCARACDAGQLCDGDTGNCITECLAPRMVCDGSCVDVASDVSHCGSCTACPDLANATRTCSSGMCRYACVGAFVDCNGDLGMPGSNGCEGVERTFYVDGDRDGWGAGAGVLACAAPAGTSTMSGDCNDADGLVYPGASEACNGVNEDCDANTDEGFAFMGLAIGARCSCEAGAATATVSCATASTATCPYPSEICNGLDDDCDGLDDETFSCVRGSSTTCTGTAGSGTSICTYSGTQVCADTCTPGACMPPAESCDGADQDCDGFVDEGALTMRPPVGGFANLDPRTRVIAAGWRDAATGGAVVLFRDEGGTGNILSFRFFDGTGAALGAAAIPLYTSTSAETALGQGVFGPAAVAWDGTRWQVFYMLYLATGGRVQRVSITPSGSVSSPVAEGFAGATAVDAVRGPTGDIGVVINNQMQAYAGVWRGGAWIAPPAAILAGRSQLEYMHVSPSRAGSFVAVGADLVGSSASAIIARQFDAAAGAYSVYSYFNGLPIESDVRAAWEGSLGRIVMTWRNNSTGAPSAALIDPNTMSFATSAVSIGSSSNGPRVDAGNGEIYLGVAPDVRRMRPDTGVAYSESLDSGWFSDAILATPGAPTQRALSFGYAFAPIDGPASRRIGCP